MFIVFFYRAKRFDVVKNHYYFDIYDNFSFLLLPEGECGMMRAFGVCRQG